MRVNCPPEGDLHTFEPALLRALRRVIAAVATVGGWNSPKISGSPRNCSGPGCASPESLPAAAAAPAAGASGMRAAVRASPVRCAMPVCRGALRWTPLLCRRPQCCALWYRNIDRVNRNSRVHRATRTPTAWRLGTVVTGIATGVHEAGRYSCGISCCWQSMCAAPSPISPSMTCDGAQAYYCSAVAKSGLPTSRRLQAGCATVHRSPNQWLTVPPLRAGLSASMHHRYFGDQMMRCKSKYVKQAEAAPIISRCSATSSQSSRACDHSNFQRATLHILRDG